MGAEPKVVRRQHVEQAVAAVRAADDAALNALAYDALSGQAEGQAFLVGAKYAQTKAEAHGVERGAAETEAGNLLGILERGATEPLERALVAAFAVRGLGDALAEDDDPKGRVFRFVRHADWLEVCSEHSVLCFVDELLEPDQAALVWRELAQRVVDDAAGRDGERPRVRATNAARLSALAGSSSEAAVEGLREVVRSSALDEPTRHLASTLAGDGAEEAPGPRPRVEGDLGRVPRGRAVEILRWVSGWAIAAWILRALGFLLGWRRRASLRLAVDGVEVSTEVSLLGRTVRQRSETWRLDSLDAVGREVRYPSIHLLVGAVALSVGVLFGGLVLFDGVRSGELVLLMLACGLLFGGAALDLALDVLVPARGGRVGLSFRPRTKPGLRLRDVPVEQADAFLRALRSASAKGRP